MKEEVKLSNQFIILFFLLLISSKIKILKYLITSKFERFIFLHIIFHNENKFSLIFSIPNISLYFDGINNNKPNSLIPSIFKL